jgi:hypothetical protein
MFSSFPALRNHKLDTNESWSTASRHFVVNYKTIKSKYDRERLTSILCLETQHRHALHCIALLEQLPTWSVNDECNSPGLIQERAISGLKYGQWLCDHKNHTFCHKHCEGSQKANKQTGRQTHATLHCQPNECKRQVDSITNRTIKGPSWREQRRVTRKRRRRGLRFSWSSRSWRITATIHVWGSGIRSNGRASGGSYTRVAEP